MRLTKNSCLCVKCFNIITSTHRHHYVVCPCGTCMTDGGTFYIRRFATPFCIDISEYEKQEEQKWQIQM